MTTPAAASSSSEPWWVTASFTPHGTNAFNVIQSANRPPNTVAGPFTSQQAAQAWIAAQTAPASISLPNPLSFLSDLKNIGHWTGIFVAAVTDPHTYISLGWLALGFGLLLLGIVLWILSTKAGQQFKAGVTTAGTVPLRA